MADFDLEKMRSVGHLRRGRSRDKTRTITHPETGEKAKETIDQLGTVITETPSRQDVNVHPETHITELIAGV